MSHIIKFIYYKFNINLHLIFIGYKQRKILYLRNIFMDMIKYNFLILFIIIEVGLLRDKYNINI